MAATRNITSIVEAEVTKAIEDHAGRITRSNADQIFEYTVFKSKVSWFVQCCTVCRRPNLVHQDPWDKHCNMEPINQNTTGEYIEQLEDHERLNQIARKFEPKQTPSKNKEQVRFREYTTWERDNSPESIISTSSHHYEHQNYEDTRKVAYKRMSMTTRTQGMNTRMTEKFCRKKNTGSIRRLSLKIKNLVKKKWKRVVIG